MAICSFRIPTCRRTSFGCFFAVQACTLMAVSMAAGMLSRRVFWSFAVPVLAALSAVSIGRLALLPGNGATATLTGADRTRQVPEEGDVRERQ